MDKNMTYWEQLRQPPAGALKLIEKGRLTGKSDINPQWRLRALTETFGPCGIGWKYEIDRQWTEEGPDGQVFAFCNVLLYICDPKAPDEYWSSPIPGTGGKLMIAKETRGLHANDEAFKMALTDALSVAMKSLGVAADVYMGFWDGSKYISPAPEKYPTVSNDLPESPEPPSATVEVVGPQATGNNETFTPEDNPTADVTVSPNASPAVVAKVEKLTDKPAVKRPRFKWDSAEVMAIRQRCNDNGIGDSTDLFRFIATKANITTWSRGIGTNQLRELENHVGIEIIDACYSKELVAQQAEEANVSS